MSVYQLACRLSLQDHGSELASPALLLWCFIVSNLQDWQPAKFISACFFFLVQLYVELFLISECSLLTCRSQQWFH